MKMSIPRPVFWLHALRAWLQGSRISVSGTGHRIVRDGARLCRTRIEVLGRDCRLTIDPGARLWDCSITLAGEGTVLHIGAGCRLRQARLVAEDPGTRLLIGAETSMTGPTLVAQEGMLLQLGRDCMIAQGSEIRNSDSHAILDEAGTRINPSADIVIGDHVWIGLGTHVLKGARIGEGTIVGARSLVRGTLPAHCLAFGTPAAPRRNDIRWVRERR